MIPVTVANLFISKVGFVVLLKSEKDDRTLPIFIGQAEAHAILFRLNNVPFPRPITHDLLKNVLDVLEARLEKVTIGDMKEGTYYATLFLAFGGQTLEVDSRPSDAIALALRCSAPVFVAEEVMDQGAVVLAEGEPEDAEAEPEEKKPDVLHELREQLERAIKEERYEDAATLRDKLKQASQAN